MNDNKKPNGINIVIEDEYHGEDIKIHKFKRKRYTLLPGVTVLVGCNGYGKTTTSHEIEDALPVKKIKSLRFDNMTDGIVNAKSEFVYSGNFLELSALMQSSEGEGIVLLLGRFLSGLKMQLQSCISNSTPLVVFLDAIDSGESINNIRHMKDAFKRIITDCNQNGVDVFIVVSANSYEMCYRNNVFDSDMFRCLDVYTFNHKEFKTYDSYAKFIMKTSDIVKKRYDEN